MTPALLAAFTGVIQGARHALEPDHVTAVATVMVESPSARRGLFYAACWGCGHAAMLIAVGGPLVFLRAELPGTVSTVLELAVGVMLVALGVRTLKGARAGAPRAPHDHGSIVVRGRRPFAIGVVHGLAGSGALAALIALGSPTMAVGLLSLTLYAFGTVLGMVALAALAGPMLARVGRLPKTATTIAQAAGALSIAVGIAWAVRTLVEI